MRDLGAVYDFSYATGINERGDVIGEFGPSMTQHAFIWTRGHGVHDLGVLPGQELSWARDINNRDQVVGSSNVFSDAPGTYAPSHPLVWTWSGGLQELPGLAGHDSSAVAEDDASLIAGNAQTAPRPDGVTHAVVWWPHRGH